MDLLRHSPPVVAQPDPQRGHAAHAQDHGHNAGALAEDHRREEGRAQEGQRRAEARGWRGQGHYEHLPCVPLALPGRLASTADADEMGSGCMAVKANMAAEDKEKMTDEEVDELLKGVQIGA